MNRKVSSLLLLLVLSITDAYLLAHPNLIGRIGVFVYKHTYIRNFPRALLTVLLVVGISLVLCELAYRFLNRRNALLLYSALEAVGIAWFVYVYMTFSTFSYRITGKAFIYGAHLLPIILTGLFSRYLLKRLLTKPLPEAGTGGIAGAEKKEF
ncbi:hypothetical protein [Dyadobacter sp. Leaf189]|uniref:hypothetical protein n=1 Tax=Dyadobacter sp. Leaf189 TaxID=1736295 RepID=UPI0006FF2F7A|nr:hypothetical protein [Dyadobacter sp. Leaf189]KQS26609.1 hypothetical protein ASG33_18710 [Dyadobacter sp. Leaf189]